MKSCVLLVLGLVLICARPAQAYIDPGTGSYLIQGIIAGVLGAGMVVRMYWQRIRAMFLGHSVVKDDDDDDR